MSWNSGGKEGRGVEGQSLRDEWFANLLSPNN